jgi:hypothetical protein
MKCPNCQLDNPDDSKFCKECGTSITSAEEAPPLFTKTLESPAYIVAQGTVFAERYEILEKIGEGGMGEVYLAIDRNLDRQVAVKVLPPAFAEDAERLARFEREAKLLAVLNHPSIAAIYGLEESDGQRFLVLELVEGETLKTKLDKGPMEVDEAVDLCHQITEGLEAAHAKGIIHRDLKPGNIMITPEGKVKILDFGLAKAFSGEPTGTVIEIEKSPTITAQMTKPGVVLGTAAYMSPEQARGRAVDKRTDIWAFGCVLYECLTGKRAFQEETVSDTIAHILKGEPDWSVLPANTPPSIRTLLRRSLQKNQKKRLHDIADARIEIEEAGSTPAEEDASARRFPLFWVLTIGAALFIAGILIRPLIWEAHESMPQAGPVASVIKLEPGYALDGRRLILEYNRPSLKAMAISSDGDFIVYCAVDDATAEDMKSQLFMRPIDELDAIPIAGTEGGIAPFLSPDDLWVGFWLDGRLKKVPVDGGVAQDLCEASDCGASWGVNDRIVYADTNNGLSVVAASGEKPENLTLPDKARQEFDHRLPSWLPDARGILFTVMQADEDQNPHVALLVNKTREWEYLLDDASHAQYVPTGHVVFLRRGVLMAIPFSLSDLERKGQAVPIRSNIMQNLNFVSANTTAGQFSISRSGDLIYAAGGVVPDWKNSLVWVDHKGNDEPASSQLDQHFTPRLSPDGQKIAYQTIWTRYQIWICDTPRDISSPFISEDRSTAPVWTPDGKKIIYAKRESDLSTGIFSRNIDGNAPSEELIVSTPPELEYYYPCSISPDGTRLACVAIGPGNTDVCIYDFPSKSVIPFKSTQYNEQYPSFSPDGRWLAYTSDHEGRFEVYVSPSSGLGGAVKISRRGGMEPGWARNGKQLFFRSIGQTEMWVVDVQTGTEFSAGTPRKLFQNTQFGAGGPRRCWDTSLDDQRFLMVKREERPFIPVTEMILIQNWFEELKRLVPTGR